MHPLMHSLSAILNKRERLHLENAKMISFSLMNYQLFFAARFELKMFAQYYSIYYLKKRKLEILFNSSPNFNLLRAVKLCLFYTLIS